MDAQPTPLTDAELDVLFRVAGLMVPDDQKAAVYNEARSLKAAAALLHGRHDATLEPSNVFSLVKAAR